MFDLELSLQVSCSIQKEKAMLGVAKQKENCSHMKNKNVMKAMPLLPMARQTKDQKEDMIQVRRQD